MASQVRVSRFLCRIRFTLFSYALVLSLAFCFAANALTAQGTNEVQPPLSVPENPLSVTPSADASNKVEPQLTDEEWGDLQLAHRRFQAAIEAYHRIPQKSAANLNKLGIAYQQMFLLDQAKKSYESSLKLDSHSAEVLNNLGTVYYSLKLYPTAERYYRKALKITPKSTLIYRNLGTNLIAENKFRKGWECYQAALTLDPNAFDTDNHFRIGDPTPIQTRGAMNFYMAKSYVLAGMKDLAVEYLRRALDERFTDCKKIMADKEFAALHDLPAFQQMILDQRSQ